MYSESGESAIQTEHYKNLVLCDRFKNAKPPEDISLLKMG